MSSGTHYRHLCYMGHPGGLDNACLCSCMEFMLVLDMVFVASLIESVYIPTVDDLPLPEAKCWCRCPTC